MTILRTITCIIAHKFLSVNIVGSGQGSIDIERSTGEKALGFAMNVIKLRIIGKI